MVVEPAPKLPPAPLPATEGNQENEKEEKKK